MGRVTVGRRQLLDGVLVVTGAVVAAVLLGLLHVPSAALFGGLLAGLVRALGWRARLTVPRAAMTGAQAVGLGDRLLEVDRRGALADRVGERQQLHRAGERRERRECTHVSRATPAQEIRRSVASKHRCGRC